MVTSRARETGKATVRDSARAEELQLAEIAAAAANPKTVLPIVSIKLPSSFDPTVLELSSLDLLSERAEGARKECNRGEEERKMDSLRLESFGQGNRRRLEASGECFDDL